PGRHRPGRGRAGVPAGVRVRPPRGALRPGRRRSPGGRRGRPGLRPHGLDQRRAGGDGRARRPRPEPVRPVARPVALAVAAGGISGLAAAWEARRQGARVVVLEADPGAGGKLRTSPLAGVAVDEAADAFLARVPEAVELCDELGLGSELVSPATGAAYVWWDGALRRLPTDQLLGIPTDLDAVAGSGILSPDGLARARADLAAPADRPAAGG